MKVPISSLIINKYQIDDFINIILSNRQYIVEIENNDNETVLITTYIKENKGENYDYN